MSVPPPANSPLSQRAFRHAPVGLAVVSLDGRWLEINSALATLFGVDAAQLGGRSVVERIHPDDHERLDADMRRLFRGAVPVVEREQRGLHANGETLDLVLRASCVRDAAGRPQHFVLEIEDITGRNRRAVQQEHLATLGALAVDGDDLEALFAAAVERAADGLGVPLAALLELQSEAESLRPVAVAGWGERRRVWPALRDSLPGYALESSEPVVVEDADTETRFDATRLSALGVRSGIAVVVPDIGGEAFGVLSINARVPRSFSDEDVRFMGALAGVLGGAIRRQRAVHDLRHQSLHDPLTGLPNRTLFLDRLTHALTRSQRTGSPLAVFFIDLDEFKVVNDSLGHQAGDELLRGLAPRLADRLRVNDTLARFGGDEFVVLCEDLADTSEALAIAERLRSLFELPCPLGEQEHYVSCSIGVAASHPAYFGRPAALIRDADAAMYRAKANGRDRVELFDDEMRARILNRLEIEQGLRRALRREELRLHYQPLVRLDGEAIVSCEALLRWEHPDRGLIGPDQFMQVAEECGLIIPLGEWALHEACRQAAAWDRPGVHPDLRTMRVAVNLSTVQVAQPNLPEVVAKALQRSGLPASRLTLEITESTLIDDPDHAARVLEALHALGVEVSLDDFGTGYSSLSSIKRYPLSAIKLDRSFIAGLAPGTPDAAIVSSVIDMAHALSLSIVAEGVETPGQRDHLRIIGCDVAQGHLFCRPQPAGDFEVSVAAASAGVRP